jgi:hypothetical protein
MNGTIDYFTREMMEAGWDSTKLQLCEKPDRIPDALVEALRTKTLDNGAKSKKSSLTIFGPLNGVIVIGGASPA